MYYFGMTEKTNGKKRILVVDDDPRILKFIHINLTAKGYDVQTAVSGEAALEKLKVQEPDLVVLDMLMPAKDGLSVLKELRTQSNVPVIMQSANSSVGIAALKSGADVFLKKPFNPEELTRHISYLLERRQN
jgi:two-component system KDP operon response regulator KdpE